MKGLRKETDLVVSVKTPDNVCYTSDYTEQGWSGRARVTVFRVCFAIALWALNSLIFQREAELRYYLQKSGYSGCTSMLSPLWH